MFIYNYFMLATSLSVPIHTYKAYAIDRRKGTYGQTDRLMKTEDWWINGQTDK